MHQINNMRQVRFIMHHACHVYYIYLRYSAMHIWCKTLALLMLLRGGICEINSPKCVFVCLIYEHHKVIFIGPVQIIKWWSFKCSIHLM